MPTKNEKQKGRRPNPKPRDETYDSKPSQNPQTSKGNAHPSFLRKGRRGNDDKLELDVIPSDELDAELSEEFQEQLRISTSTSAEHEHAIIQKIQRDRVQQWRQDTAVDELKSRPHHSQQKPQSRHSSVRGAEPYSGTRNSERSATHPLQDGRRHNPIHEKSMKASTNKKTPQMKFLSSPLQERRDDDSEPSPVFETKRGQPAAGRIREDLLKIAARNAARNSSDMEQSVMDTRSDTTFSMPSASQAWVAQEKGQAEVIYYNKRGGNMDSHTQLLSTIGAHTNSRKPLKVHSTKTVIAPGTGPKQDVRPETTRGQVHRKKTAQVQYDYSS